MLRFTDPADAGEAKARLHGLVGVVPALLSMQVDLDVLRTEASWDLALVSTHTDLEGLKAYQGHPAHVEFLEWMRPRLAQRACVDAEV
ncbi:MAG: Dabb family protein [Actinomycetota bacterium]|nr:Dabb family protein [Actinomycetota bacterium]